MRTPVFLAAFACWFTTCSLAATPSLELDHVLIMVSPDAPERAALERAGFLISPDVNHHEGQGTSSITADFQNSYLELAWVDPKVSVAPVTGTT